ncbi:uncharacterized protein LOC134235558 [Saccostrea cucullata]|uniref:uncharacterized protein LOC134235558 n=1 Tax=Saccostrea cuccullata TaxID=36930 RepID=UPI002ED3536F
MQQCRGDMRCRLEGYIGTRCFNACQAGYYGENCANLCPATWNRTCHHVHGSCSEENKETNPVADMTFNATLAVVIIIAVVVSIIAVVGIIVIIRRNKLNLFHRPRKVEQPQAQQNEERNVRHGDTHMQDGNSFYEECLVDSGFAHIRKLYRRSGIDSLAQFFTLVNKSASSNEAVSYDDTWQWRNWKDFLSTYFRPVKRNDVGLSFDELSRDKIATQSKVFGCIPPCGPEKAIDGDIETCMKNDAIGQNSPDKTVWWTIDLGSNLNIYSIIVYFRDYGDYEMRQRGRFAGFSLYISDTPNKEDGTLCYKDELPLPPLEFNTTCIGYGRYVIYYNERLDGVTYPNGYVTNPITELCEVKVTGCSKAEVYGSNCSIPCPTHCQDQRCNIVNGTCLGCKPGYEGEMCKTECPGGLYGKLCKRQCAGHCRGNRTCDHVTGNCKEGCAAGWIGKQCDQKCKEGTYGDGCAHNCSVYCLEGNTFCNNENGHCEKGCNPGYEGNRCTKFCQSGSFGQNCSKHCSEHCNGICDNINGTCSEGCSKGYTGIRCFDREEAGLQVLNASSLNAINLVVVLGACSAAIIIFALTVIFIRLKKQAGIKLLKKMEVTLKETSSTMELIQKEKSNIQAPNNQNRVDDVHHTAKKGRPTNKIIPVRNLNTFITKMSAAENAGFKHEYHVRQYRCT